MTPHICVVCNGRTTMKNSFYHPEKPITTAGDYDVSCKSCHGTGVIWEPHNNPTTITDDWWLTTSATTSWDGTIREIYNSY